MTLEYLFISNHNASYSTRPLILQGLSRNNVSGMFKLESMD